MKNNFYNIPDDWYKEFNNTFNITNKVNMDMDIDMNMDTNNTNPELTDLKEGFLKGNLFKDLYNPYKNYKYGMLSPSSEKEQLLYNILMYKFALNDLNIYLDNYPNDIKCINLYNKYLAEETKLIDQYEKKYGPLTTDSKYLGENTWKWIKSPWPWEGTK